MNMMGIKATIGVAHAKFSVEQDPKMNQAQKVAVEKSMDILAKCHGDTAKLSDQDKAMVADGDKAFNASHGTHFDHLHTKPRLGLQLAPMLSVNTQTLAGTAGPQGQQAMGATKTV